MSAVLLHVRRHARVLHGNMQHTIPAHRVSPVMGGRLKGYYLLGSIMHTGPAGGLEVLEDFFKFIKVEFDRRIPKDQQPKLTAEALAHHTPKTKKTKGSNTPIGEVIGMMGGLG